MANAVTKMGKAELIEKMVELGTPSKNAADNSIKAVLDAIKKLLVEGSIGSERAELTLSGFGSFKTARTKARVGRNPATGGPADIPASRRVDFSASQPFKDAVKAVK